MLVSKKYYFIGVVLVVAFSMGIFSQANAQTKTPAASTTTKTSTNQVNTNQPGCAGQSTGDSVTSVCTDLGSFSTIGDFIAAAINTWVVPIAVVGAIVMITVAGFLYISSGGSPDGIKLAKELIVGAILGLALLFMASYILNAIIPSSDSTINLSYQNYINNQV